MSGISKEERAKRPAASLESFGSSATIRLTMNKNRKFGRDPGLQARMLLTLFLLGLVYAVLVGVLIAAGVGAIAVAVIAGAFFLIQYFTSDKIALASMGAREVKPDDGPWAPRADRDGPAALHPGRHPDAARRDLRDVDAERVRRWTHAPRPRPSV